MADGGRAFPIDKDTKSRLRRTRVDYASNDTMAPAEIQRLDRIANLLDSRFKVLGFRFGFDGLLGLIPVVGDAAALGISGYLIAEAARSGAKKRTIMKMAMNTGVDALIGSIPLVGDVFDFAFKANNRNIRLLRRDMQRRHDERSKSDPMTVNLR